MCTRGQIDAIGDEAIRALSVCRTGFSLPARRLLPAAVSWLWRGLMHHTIISSLLPAATETTPNPDTTHTRLRHRQVPNGIPLCYTLDAATLAPRLPDGGRASEIGFRGEYIATAENAATLAQFYDGELRALREVGGACSRRDAGVACADRRRAARA